jgi:4-hydroxy-2-oxoheptanedioate aldolase
VTQAKHYFSLGALFVAVGLDTQILVRQTSALVRQFKPDAGIALPTSGQVY